MCTWNSNKPYFVRCLNSVRREIPIHHFILIDRFSNDGTVETVKKLFPNAIIKETNANLGVARKIGIEAVDTEFFVFIDDDVELCNGWFREIIAYIDPTTGAIHGQAVPMLKYQRKWFEWMWKKWLPYRKGAVERVQIITAGNSDATRGYTNNTLIRKKAIEDWSPFPFLCAYEDHMLLRHIVRKGYTWKIITNLSVKHWGRHQPYGYIKKGSVEQSWS
jgi:glycosyltransferase involved in cell wall biosynthesis